jgi:hypothetical protein
MKHVVIAFLGAAGAAGSVGNIYLIPTGPYHYAGFSL